MSRQTEWLKKTLQIKKILEAGHENLSLKTFKRMDQKGQGLRLIERCKTKV